MFLKRSDDDLERSKHVKEYKFIQIIYYNSVQCQAVHKQSPNSR
jgi:hypothetical protein